MPTISFSISGTDSLAAVADSLKDNIATAIQDECLPLIRDTWLEAVSGHQLPGMERSINSAEYAAALQRPEALEYPVGGDPLHGQVVVNDRQVQKIEEGTSARDMKPALLSGRKARRGKKGQRYNIIPIGLKTESGFDAWQFHGVSPFRTVSDFSPADSWIYPAKPGVAVLESVTMAIAPRVQEIIERAVSEWK